MKKKGTIIMTVTTGIACFVLSMIIFMQFKVVHETDVTAIDKMREADLQTELVNWKTKYTEAQSKYEEVSATLNKYKEESNSDEKSKANLEEELQKLKEALGQTDVEGKGIIITLKETSESTESIDANVLLRIVNYLRDAGADAISVNGQRVVNKTDFAYIQTFIKVNSQRISSPYEIKAIGDQDYLKSALVGKDGYIEKLQAVGHTVTVEEKNKVKITKYQGDMSTKYMKSK